MSINEHVYDLALQTQELNMCVRDRKAIAPLDHPKEPVVPELLRDIASSLTIHGTEDTKWCTQQLDQAIARLLKGAGAKMMSSGLISADVVERIYELRNEMVATPLEERTAPKFVSDLTELRALLLEAATHFANQITDFRALRSEMTSEYTAATQAANKLVEQAQSNVEFEASRLARKVLMEDVGNVADVLFSLFEIKQWPIFLRAIVTESQWVDPGGLPEVHDHARAALQAMLDADFFAFDVTEACSDGLKALGYKTSGVYTWFETLKMKPAAMAARMCAHREDAKSIIDKLIHLDTKELKSARAAIETLVSGIGHDLQADLLGRFYDVYANDPQAKFIEKIVYEANEEELSHAYEDSTLLENLKLGNREEAVRISELLDRVRVSFLKKRLASTWVLFAALPEDLRDYLISRDDHEIFPA